MTQETLWRLLSMEVTPNEALGVDTATWTLHALGQTFVVSVTGKSPLLTVNALNALRAAAANLAISVGAEVPGARKATAADLPGEEKLQ